MSARPGPILHEREAHVHSLLEAIEEAYYEVDLRGNVLRCNSAFQRMLGYVERELIGRNNRQFQTQTAAAAVYPLFNRVYRTGLPVTGCEWELQRKDGSTLLVEGSIHLMRDGDGTPIGFHGFQRDVTEQRRTERALRESEAKYRGILETIEDAYYEVDLAGVLVLCNGAFCRLLGRPVEEILGRSYREFQTAEVALQVAEVFNQVYRTGEPAQCFDWTLIRKDGTSVTGEGSVQLVRDLGGKPCGFRGILRDVTERRRVEHALRESEARFRALTRLSSDWYWEQDTEFRYTRMESRRSRAEGASAEFIGRCPWESGLEIEGGWDAHRALLAAHRPFRDVIMHRRLGRGRLYYISVSGEPFYRADGSFAGYRGVSREITDQKLAEDRIQHLATHDALTGLPNRFMFSQLLALTINQAQRSRTQCAILFIDLDRFKTINDTLGHDAGDALLREVTERFRASLRSSDVIARLGGDEFVVLIRDMQDAGQAAVVARKILAAAIRPVLLAGREMRVTASIGVAMYPQDGQDERTLMKNADIAMYAAKAEGKNNVCFYSREIGQQSPERLTLESELQNALERGEFSLRYQPKLHLQHGRICGVEALLRWHNRELGEVSPNQFIPLAEETGLIVDIGKWALRTACAQNVAWQEAGLPPLSMAVNLSVRQFADENLLRDIAAILAQTRMAAQLLELEITEGIVIHQPIRAARLLEDIKRMGVRLALDDFGTGYSSLGQLKKFPIDTLKIDRSFIRDIATNPGDRALTEAIIGMGRALGLAVVAEGVETREQEAFLRSHGCDELQGFHFSRPLPANELAALLAAFPGNA